MIFMYSIVLSTCSSEKEAKKIADNLLNKKLVACVNMVNNVKSIYWWGNKILNDKECLMIMKTKKSLVKNVISTIKKIHSYKVPEIIELPIVKGNEDYLNWISEVVK